jgi:hypothetical protein
MNAKSRPATTIRLPLSARRARIRLAWSQAQYNPDPKVSRGYPSIRQKRSYILPLVHWLWNPTSCLPFHRQTDFLEQVR